MQKFKIIPFSYLELPGGVAPPGLVTVRVSYPQSVARGPSVAAAVEEMP